MRFKTKEGRNITPLAIEVRVHDIHGDVVMYYPISTSDGAPEWSDKLRQAVGVSQQYEESGGGHMHYPIFLDAVDFDTGEALKLPYRHNKQEQRV